MSRSFKLTLPPPFLCSVILRSSTREEENQKDRFIALLSKESSRTGKYIIEEYKYISKL